MSLTKKEALERTSFGKRIAEEEVDDLASYFVETDQWRRIFAGEVDIVFGDKGAGKSAIYSLLVSRAEDLFDRGIVLVPAEKPRGTPAFKDLVTALRDRGHQAKREAAPGPRRHRHWSFGIRVPFESRV